VNCQLGNGQVTTRFVFVSLRCKLFKHTFSSQKFLETLAHPERGKTSVIKSFTEHHSDQTVHFEITVTKQQLEQFNMDNQEELVKLFRLDNRVNSNLIMFDDAGKIKEYMDAREVINEFYDVCYFLVLSL
jgi:DNA topoisomerase II